MADDMTQKIAAIHDFANGYSLAHSKDVRETRDQEFKVEIPETGISILDLSAADKTQLMSMRARDGR
jgi:hypothetical protein